MLTETLLYSSWINASKFYFVLGYGSAPGYPPQMGYPPARGGPPGYGMGYGGAPPGVDPTLWNWFVAVDADRSGQISALELQRALLNGNWSQFNPETCRLMIGKDQHLPRFSRYRYWVQVLADYPSWIQLWNSLCAIHVKFGSTMWGIPHTSFLKEGILLGFRFVLLEWMQRG